jgi:PAS domain S-box-containing protein
MTDVTKIDAFVQSSPHPAWLATSRGECLYVNPALERLVGLKSDEINQLDWRSFVLEEDRAAASASWQRSLASGTPYRTTVRLQGIDGVPATVELIAFGHSLNEGTELWLFTGLFVRGATQQYSGLEAELQATLNVIPAYTWYALPSGGLTFVSERTGDSLGLPKDHPLRFGIDRGAEWDAHIHFLHPDDQEEARRIWSVCLSTGSAGENRQRVRNAKGEYRWFLSRAEPLRASDGTLLYWIGVNLDIDERKRAEERLAKNAKELQRSDFYLTEAQRLGHLGNWVFDPAKGFEYWSDELFRIYDLDPVKGPPDVRQYLEAVHPQDREFMASLMKRMLSGDFGFDVTKRIVRASGEVRYVRCVGTVDSDNDPSKRIGVGIDVTDHEVLTQELRRREACLAEAQRLSHTGSFGWKPGSGEIVFSEETYRIYEYDPTGNVTLDRIIEQIHPDDRDLVLETAGRASRTGAAIDFTHRLLFADGRVKYLHVLAKRLQSASDEVEFAGAVIDITEAKRAEEAIRKSEKELRTLVEAIPAYVGTARPDGSCDFLSESWLDYLGFTREQGLGWGWADTVHPEDVDRVVASWRAGLAAREPVEQELRCRSADGTYHWFLNRDSPLIDNEGNVIKWYGTLTNIDAMKETEHALQMREHELLSIVDTVPSMLWSTSPTGESTHLSQRFREYWGVSFEEIANRGWVNLIHPDDREDTTEAFFRAIETGDSFSTTQRLRRADGEYRWHHSMGEPLRDPDGKIIQWYGLSIDIDERKRTEDHLRDTRVKLTTALRIATVAELSASIAHELNQPLMAVLGNAQAAKRWLAANPPDLAETSASIERVLRDIRSADTTMQHIRALFKREPYEKSDESVLDIIRDSLRFVRDSPNKREVEIVWSIEGSLPLICVDRIQTQQVFINLISNAIEATDGNRNTARIRLAAFATQEHEVVVQVIDNGTGLEDTEKIFDAFVTTKEKGLGIGLAVSKTIVEAHGGRLWAKNNSDGGATFNVALPMASKGGSNSFEFKEPHS